MMPRMKGAGGTMFDRMKQTGYLTGPNHDMGPAMADMSPAADEPESSAGGPPPNLRDADGAESCGDCEYFESAPDTGGSCTKFNTPVTTNQTCDAFEPKSEEGEPDNGEEIGPGPEEGQ